MSWIARAAWVAKRRETTLLKEWPRLVEQRSETGAGLPHALFMLRELLGRTPGAFDSETKVCHWLGYVQAILVQENVIELENAKQLNLASREATWC